MIAGQIQVRLSLSKYLYEFLEAKSKRLGIPITQVIRHLVINEWEREEAKKES